MSAYSEQSKRAIITYRDAVVVGVLEEVSEIEVVEPGPAFEVVGICDVVEVLYFIIHQNAHWRQFDGNIRRSSRLRPLIPQNGSSEWIREEILRKSWSRTGEQSQDSPPQTRED